MDCRSASLHRRALLSRRGGSFRTSRRRWSGRRQRSSNQRNHPGRTGANGPAGLSLNPFGTRSRAISRRRNSPSLPLQPAFFRGFDVVRGACGVPCCRDDQRKTVHRRRPHASGNRHRRSNLTSRCLPPQLRPARRHERRQRQRQPIEPLDRSRRQRRKNRHPPPEAKTTRRLAL